MKHLLTPEENVAFFAAMQMPSPTSIRLNLFKSPDGQQPEPIHQRWVRPNGPDTINVETLTDNRVPWHPNGFYLPERPLFTLDPIFHAGAYYVQEASSMFLHEALRHTVDFSKPLIVLDLCAAPGGKSTLLADMLGAESLLLANEVIRPRVGTLRENLEKWGAPNTAASNAEAQELAALEGFFDVVVTDAPCSGEGLFRKDPDAMREWSPAHVVSCSARQRHILESALNTLKPGGILVYSTCTFNRAENEENTTWLTQHFDVELLRLDIPPAWGIAETEGGYRFFPHRVIGEGFFISIFRKKEGAAKRHQPASGFKSIKPIAKNQVTDIAQWLNAEIEVRFFQTISGEILALPAALEGSYLILEKFLKSKWFGTKLGEYKGKDFVPSHALALSQLASPTLPSLDLEHDQSLRFLKKETFDLPPGTPRGWTLARHHGLNLGWLKVLPERMNNYLPAERRIRMAIDRAVD